MQSYSRPVNGQRSYLTALNLVAAIEILCYKNVKGLNKCVRRIHNAWLFIFFNHPCVNIALVFIISLL